VLWALVLLQGAQQGNGHSLVRDRVAVVCKGKDKIVVYLNLKKEEAER
jgi:hypothetical protein